MARPANRYTSAPSARNGPNGTWTSRSDWPRGAAPARRRRAAIRWQADERAQERAREDDERQRLPAERDADDRQQLAVAEAQALALEHVVVEVGDEADEQVAGGGADDAREPGRLVDAEAREKKTAIDGNVMTSGSS